MPRVRQAEVSSIIFVFGSNLAGRHGKGAALDAACFWGAERGKFSGRVGQSYAIPTKDRDMRALPLKAIQFFIDDFLLYAAARPDLDFQVTALGTGLAGYMVKEIAPLFRRATPNVHLPLSWKPYLSRD